MGIPTMIYYPLPLYKQEAFSHFVQEGFTLTNAENLCKSVLSLPIHTEMTTDVLDYISESILQFQE